MVLEPAFEVIMWVSVGIVMTALIMLAGTLMMRYYQLVEERRQMALEELWAPILAACLYEMPARLPKIKRRDVMYFLLLWNRFQEKLRRESRIILGQVLYRLDLVPAVMGYLKSRDQNQRVLAALTLGNLGEKLAFNRLARLALEDEGLAGQMAALALARIDREAAAPIVVPLIAERRDWPVSRLATLLNEIGPELAAAYFVPVWETADKGDWPRLMRLVGLLERREAITLVQSILKNESDPELLAAALAAVRGLGAAECLEAVREYLDHPSWQVRVQAVNALGSLAGEQDVPALEASLSDENWWVRYRSAQALVSLPFLSYDELIALRDRQADRFARDIIEQAIAERRM